MTNLGDNIQKAAEENMPNAAEGIEKAKNKMPNVTPTPPDLHQQAAPAELKARLQWGEPGLTIIDVRDREAFNNIRIMGAISMPLEDLADRSRGQFESNRDIYVYGDNDEQTAQASRILRDGGLQRVAELKGGLQAWMQIGGSTEGRDSVGQNQPSEFNVVSRLQEQARVRQNEKRQGV